MVGQVDLGGGKGDVTEGVADRANEVILLEWQLGKGGHKQVVLSHSSTEVSEVGPQARIFPLGLSCLAELGPAPVCVVDPK